MLYCRKKKYFIKISIAKGFWRPCRITGGTTWFDDTSGSIWFYAKRSALAAVLARTQGK